MRWFCVQRDVRAIVILKIVQAGDPALRETARPLTPKEIGSGEIKQLIQNMRETMYDAPGVGLAAPQIGLPLQIAVIEDPESILDDVPAQELALKERRPVPFHVIINPVITRLSEDTAHFYEGCLSLEGFSAVVPRSRTIRVEYLDERGKARSADASGWYARILQHEIDHLRGALYIDRMQSRTFTSAENWNQFWKGKPIPVPSSRAPKS
jgi:peptide deformylase